MARHNIKKQEILTGRISILFFYTLLMIAFTRLLRFANDRFNLVFRGWLPWLLPILLAVCAVGLWACRRAVRKGEEEAKLFSASFGVYLLVAPILAIAPPMIAVWVRPLFSSLETLGLVKLASRISVCLLIGYFIAYTLYHQIKPGAGLLAWGIAGQIALVYYYFTTQLARTTSTITPFDELTPFSSALLMAVLAALITLVMILFEKKDRFSIPKIGNWIPLGLSVLFLAVTVLFDFSFTVREILLYVFCGLQWVSLAVFCVILRKKN